ncbi:MAG: signal peptidase I [Dysgonamonadaceae bacterium]|nr:signal peptidase I [Dysgonamonadaceae bacterium]
MSKTKKRKFLVIILSSLVIALILRAFVFESYKMPSSQMENAVLRRDYLFVNKLAYGIRMPMTWLSIPFIPDSIPALRMKTYSGFLSLPYRRFFERRIRRNDIVLYNIPSLRKDVPIDKLPLSISRCIGLSGDSVEVLNGSYFINANRIAQSPDLILPYKYLQQFDSAITLAMNKLNIPIRKTVSNRDNHITRFFSRFEAFSLREELPDSINIILEEREDLNYKLFIPKRGLTVKLTPENLHIYEQIILDELKDNAETIFGELYIDNKLTEYYTFKSDYYWMLSDNTEASADSRHFGFIPETHIVGKANLIWMSKNPNRIFSKIH